MEFLLVVAWVLMYIVDRTTSAVYEYTAAGINVPRPVGANITNGTVDTCVGSSETGLEPKPDLRSQFYY